MISFSITDDHDLQQPESMNDITCALPYYINGVYSSVERLTKSPDAQKYPSLGYLVIPGDAENGGIIYDFRRMDEEGMKQISSSRDGSRYTIELCAFSDILRLYRSGNHAALARDLFYFGMLLDRIDRNLVSVVKDDDNAITLQWCIDNKPEVADALINISVIGLLHRAARSCPASSPTPHVMVPRQHYDSHASTSPQGMASRHT